MREVITLKMATLMKVYRSHGKFGIEGNKSDGKNPYRASSTVCNLPCNNIFSSVGLCTTLVDHYIACKKHKHFGIKHLASFSLMLAQYHFIFIFETQLQWFGYRIFKMNFYDLLISLSSNLRYRRYYMATWIYKISL